MRYNTTYNAGYVCNFQLIVAEEIKSLPLLLPFVRFWGN
jgi:hypothetical protein